MSSDSTRIVHTSSLELSGYLKGMYDKLDIMAFDHKQLVKYYQQMDTQSRIAQIAVVSQPYVNRILKQGYRL